MTREHLAKMIRCAPLLPPPGDVEVAVLAREMLAAMDEIDRLTTWLERIDGGDVPCNDADTLRLWAYEALTLWKVAP